MPMHNHVMHQPTLPAISAVALLIALVLPACSNRQIYEGLQAGQRNECQRLAEPSAASASNARTSGTTTTRKSATRPNRKWIEAARQLRCGAGFGF